MSRSAKTLKRYSFLALTVACAWLASSCTDPDRPGSSPEPKGVLLLYVAQGEAANQLRVVNVGTGTHRDTAKVPADAEVRFWDFSAARALLTTPDRSIWQVSWTSGESQPVASLPADLTGDLISIWVDEPGEQVRALEMRPVEKSAAEGRTVEPPDALPYDAIVWEHGGQAGWHVVQKIETSWGADGSPGYAVAKSERHEKGLSALTAKERTTCSELCEQDVPAEVQQLLPKDLDVDAADLKLLDVPAASSRLIFSLAWGDGPHATGPAWIISSGGAVKQLPVAAGPPLRFAPNGTYLLVAGESQGENPRVIDLQSAKVVFDQPGTAAVWLPGDR